MNKAFSNFTWENDPSVNTPLSADNLNKVNSALDTVDTRVVQHETTKANQTDVLISLKDVTLDEKTGKFTFTRHNGTTVVLDTKLEKLILNWRFDNIAQILYLILEDGTEMPVDLSAFITNVEFADSETIRYSITEGGKVVFDIIDGSITGDKLEPNYLANVQIQAENASKSASNALQSATEAEASAVRAEEAAEKAEGIVGGDFATNSRVDDIVNGTTKVGNADKLDGHDSEYFAKSTDLANYFKNTGGIVGDGITNMPLGIKGGSAISFVDFMLNDGTKLGSLGMIGLNKPTFLTNDLSAFYELLHAGNVGDYALAKTGGDLTGPLVFNYNGRNAYFIITDDGRLALTDATNGKVLIESSADGKTNTFNGTASGNLSKSGGKVSNEQGTVVIIENTNENIPNIRFQGSNGSLGNIGFNGADNPTFWQSNGYTAHSFLHTGNSAKVVVSDTAPTDTSAVWFDTSA